MDEERLKELVISRLNAMPPDVSFSIGDYGSFTRDGLIREVREGSAVGKAAEEIELKFLRSLPTLAGRLG